MAEPYYSDDLVTLYHGDCLELFDWLEADVLVTDPPYGTTKLKNNPKGGYGRRGVGGLPPEGFVIANDETTEIRDKALLIWGKKPALIFGSPRMPEPPGEWADRLVWNKKRPGMNGGPWRYLHESIFVTEGFVRKDNGSFSILSYYPKKETKHVHEKPLDLMTHLILRAPEGVIADPFAGTGTTLIAAKNLGIKAIGVEFNESYCNQIAERLEKQVLQLQLGD